ncbi:MAG: hypothetical protein U0175_07735 [Caldilineaceae bacterium]
MSQPLPLVPIIRSSQGSNLTLFGALISDLARNVCDDLVGLAILDPARFTFDISSGERDNPASLLEGNNDSLGLAGVITPASSILKFEKRLVVSTDRDVQISSEESGAEYLSKPVGEESGEDAMLTNRIFLPLLNR